MPRSATRPFQPPHLSSTMETLKSIFTCCIPGRRSRSQQSQSQSGQHTESTPLLHGQSGLAQQSSKSPNAPSTSIQKAGARGEASSSSSSSPAPVPTYTIRDLAVITGWAREHFLQVNDAGVFEQRSSRVVGEGAGKRKSLVEPVALAEAQVDKEVSSGD